MNRRELLKKIGLVGLIPVVLPGMILRAQQGTSEGHGGTVVLTGGNLAVDEVKKHFIENGWARKNGKLIRTVFYEVPWIHGTSKDSEVDRYAILVYNNPESPSTVFIKDEFKRKEDADKKLVECRSFEYDVVYSKGERV